MVSEGLGLVRKVVRGGIREGKGWQHVVSLENVLRGKPVVQVWHFEGLYHGTAALLYKSL